MNDEPQFDPDVAHARTIGLYLAWFTEHVSETSRIVVRRHYHGALPEQIGSWPVTGPDHLAAANVSLTLRGWSRASLWQRVEDGYAAIVTRQRGES